VIKSRIVDLGPSFKINRFHEVNFYTKRTVTGYSNILIDILGFASKVACQSQAQDINPKFAESTLICTPYRYLLDS
jgi:hypothetical protein